MEVSVIIPVYNATAYIEKAINSALQQFEVKEVIVVNDGNTDDLLQLLEKLRQQDARIKIYHHPNQENRGRSASRNLGIKKATKNFIAFLDADDFYLMNRFESDKKIFQENKKIDGVYNAVGFHFYRDATIIEKESLILNTVTQKIKPEELFKALTSGRYGHFQIDGLTVKKSVFEAIGFFNESLMVAEDTDVFWKMALKCQLETGIILRPVAMRGVHDANVFNREDLYKKYRFKMFETLILWCSQEQIPLSKIDILFIWLWKLRFREKNNLIKDIIYWAYLFIPNPKLLFSILSIKYFPIIRLRKVLFPFLYRK